MVLTLVRTIVTEDLFTFFTSNEVWRNDCVLEVFISSANQASHRPCLLQSLWLWPLVVH